MLLAPLALEGAYRALRVAALSPATHPALARHDERLGWVLEPARTVRHRSSEFDVEVRTNAHGFRGPDWSKGDRTRPRILVLGDSLSFGWGVSHEQSLVGLLQARRPEWEVLGAGVPGYGTDQQCWLLEELAPRLEPDAVVVVFCENDLLDSSVTVAHGWRRPRFVLEDGEPILRGAPVRVPWLERRSLAWRAVRKVLWERSLLEHPRDPNAEWALVCAIYRRMAQVLRGRPLVIASSAERLGRFARDEPGIEHADLRPALADGVTAFPVDGHWSELGHARVAAALERALAALLP